MGCFAEKCGFDIKIISAATPCPSFIMGLTAAKVPSSWCFFSFHPATWFVMTAVSWGKEEVQIWALVHLSAANEASNFYANLMQLYHSPGCKFKYSVAFFNIFSAPLQDVLSAICFGFYLSKRWGGELAAVSAAHQWCGRLSNLWLPDPHCPWLL